MKLMVISFLLFVVPFVSALNFNFIHPDSVSLNENFSVDLSATTSDIYDVKIFVQDNITKIIISEIYNDGWKNPYYYLKSAFPQNTKFLIRLKNYSNYAAICARLRKSGSSTYTEKCGEVKISQSAENPPSLPLVNLSEAQEKKNETIVNQSQEKNETVMEFIPQNNSKNKQPSSSQDSGRIYLNPKTTQKKDFVTQEEKIRLLAVYSFTAFAIVIIILLALKRL